MSTGEFDFPSCAVPGCRQHAASIVHRHGRRLVACIDHGDPPFGNGAAARLLDDDRKQALLSSRMTNGVPSMRGSGILIPLLKERLYALFGGS